MKCEWGRNSVAAMSYIVCGYVFSLQSNGNITGNNHYYKQYIWGQMECSLNIKRRICRSFGKCMLLAVRNDWKTWFSKWILMKIALNDSWGRWGRWARLNWANQFAVTWFLIGRLIFNNWSEWNKFIRESIWSYFFAKIS